MKINLKKQIEKYLKGEGVNMFWLSKKSGVSPAVLSRFMRGQRDITWRTAKKIIDIVLT